LAVLRAELSKLYRQRITYASFVVLIVLVGLVTWGSHHGRKHLELQEQISSEFVVTGRTITALFVARAIMEVALAVLVPMLIAVVVGALVAGERQSGTLRTLMIRPVARWWVLSAKLLTGWSFAAAVTIFLGIAGLTIGWLVFGWGDLVIFSGGLTVLDAHTGLVRLVLAYLLAVAAMCTVAALALMFSTIFDNSMAAAGLTVATLLVMGIVGELPYFEHMRPHLLTTHLRFYSEMFAATVNRAALVTSAAYLAGYTIVTTIIAIIIFQRRDITC